MLEVLDGSLIRLVNKLLAVTPMESQLVARWDPESGGMDVSRRFGVWGKGGWSRGWVVLKPP